MARGRPSKLTPKLREAICADIVATGAPVDVVASAHGIHRDTFYDWVARGRRESSGPYRDFSDSVARAKSQWKLEALRKIEHVELHVTDLRAAQSLIKAITWKLERLDRDTFGAAITVKVEEAKQYFLNELESVCERMGKAEVFEEFLQELVRAGSPEDSGAAGQEDGPPIH